MRNSPTFRFATVSALLLALATPALSYAQDAEAADAAWRAASAAMNKKDYATCVTQSRAAFTHGAEAYERWGWLHLALGVCLGGRRQFDEAISELQTAKELVTDDGERFQVNHNLAQVYLGRANSGDYDRAIAAENEASKYAPSNQRVAIAKTLGQAYYLKEDWRRAIEHLKTTTDASGNDGDAWQKLARAYAEAGQDANAKTSFEKTLMLDRNNKTALFYLGRFAMDARDWTGSIRYLEEAVRQDAQNMQFRGMLGRAYLSAKRYEDAVRALSQVASARSTDGTVHYNLGKAHMASGSDGKAIESFNNALRYLAGGTQTRGECLYDVGFVYERQQSFEDALRAFEDSAAIAPGTKTTEAIDRVKERIRRAKEAG